MKISFFLRIISVCVLSGMISALPATAAAISTGFDWSKAIYPVRKGDGYITQGFWKYHPAIDIAPKIKGTHPEIYAAANGKVVMAGPCPTTAWCQNDGVVVLLKHENGYETFYGHLDHAVVNVGDTVEVGQAIGLMGNTGTMPSTVGKPELPLSQRWKDGGIMLHFEICKTDCGQRNPSTKIDPTKVLRSTLSGR